MKKCGRFVAGMFGTSLSLAMLSGAFLMADKGAVEAEAADGDVVITLDNEDFGRAGTNTVLTAEKGGVSFEGKLRTTSSNGSPYNFLMFDENGSYLTNTSTLEGYYVSGISWNYTGDTGVSGKVYHSFLNESNKAVSAVGTAVSPEKNGSHSFGNSDESLGYFNISTTNKNVQFDDITITFSPTTSYDHISVSGQPTKTEYYVGDSFLTDGLTVNAYTTAEDTDPTDVTDLVQWTVDPATFNDTATTSVTVTATFGDLTVSKDFEITVAERPVFTTLEATGLKKTSYKGGEKLDTTGLVVTAKTADGSDSYVVNPSEYTIDKTELTFDDVVAGKATITVTYGELKATFEVDVSAMTISEFRAKDGQFGVIKGIITGRAKDSKYSNSDLYLNDGAAGIRLYRVDDKIGADLKVGDEIIISGTCDNYNETYELTDAEEVLVLDSGKSVAPTALDSIAQDTFAGKDGLYVKIDGLHYADDGSKLWNGSKKGAMTLTKGGTEIEAYPLADSSAQDAQDYLDDFLSKIEGLPFTFTGHLGTNYGTYQIMVTASSEFSCPAYDEILDFIKNFMHMNQWVGSAASGDNECLDLFPVAKEALEKLSEAQQTYFLKSDNPEIAEAQARYKAWEAAQGDQNAASVIMNTVNENKGTIIAVSAVAALGVVGAAALLISRKKRSAKNK